MTLRERALAALCVVLAACVAALWLRASEPTAAPAAAPEPVTRTVVLRPFQPVAFSTDFFGLRYEGHSREQLDRHVLLYGAWEKPVLFFLRDAAQAIAARTDRGGAPVHFVDVGANTGQHSLFMAQHVDRVHAIEPWQRVLERLRHHIALNELENIEIHPVGLGAEPAELPFFEPPESNLGIGSFVDGFAVANRPSQLRMQIVTATPWSSRARFRASTFSRWTSRATSARRSPGCGRRSSATGRSGSSR